MVEKKKHFSRVIKSVVLVLIFGVVVLAALGVPPQQSGHSSNEMNPIVQEKTAACAGPACSAACDPGYMVFSGACASTASGEWNLFGARADYVHWDCVDGTGGLSTVVSVKVTCVKAEFDVVSSPFCGDYVVEPPEVCDGPNLGGYDCTDFFTTQGAQLCNGVIGACSSSCNALSVAPSSSTLVVQPVSSPMKSRSQESAIVQESAFVHISIV